MAALRPTRLITAVLIAAVLIAVAGLGAVPWLVRAAEPCAWRHPGKPPRLFLDGRVAVFRRYYDSRWAACAAPSGGRVKVEWRAGSDPQAPPLESDELELSRRPSETPYRLEAKLFPNHVCDARKGPPRGKLALTGVPGEERVSELVPVRVSLLAQGPLAPLAYESPPLEFPCPVCEARGKSSLGVREDAQGNLALEGELDAGWFECARQGATLMLLGFAGGSREVVQNAVRPSLVLRDLEQKFVRKGGAYVLREPLAKSRLCAGGSIWSFELWGKGELMSAAGGGRTPYELRCRRAPLE